MKRIAHACFLLLSLLAVLAFTACQSSASVNVGRSELAPTSTPAATPTATVLAAPPPVPDAPTKLVAEVIKSDSLLRDGPGEAGVIINKLGPGALLTVRHPERGGPWYEVTYEAAGQSGWIHGSLIKFKTGATPLYTPTPKPAPSPRPTVEAADEADDEENADDSGDESDSIKVWVNTNSGVYHCPGTRWYGDTKEGEYMTQAQAVAEGNRPAYHRRCY